MSRTPNAVPSFRKHRPTGQAVTTVKLANGQRKDLYLGRHGTAAAKAEYARIVALTAANGGIYPSQADDLTVNEAILAYIQHIKPTAGRELSTIKKACRTIRELYGRTPACEFGPKALKVVQQNWIDRGTTRQGCNRLLATVKRCWKWLVSEEMVPAENLMAMKTIAGVKSGASAVPEREPVAPANPDDVERVIPFLPTGVAPIVQLQVLTGARCGELVKLRVGELDRTGNIWAFSPAGHKTAWRGKSRTIFFGVRAQAILEPLLAEAGDDYVFSPRRNEEKRRALNHDKRKTKKWPSHMRRNERKRKMAPKRTAGERYATQEVRRAIDRACKAAGVPRFSPHRLRHMAGLRIRNEFGLEHARALLGHSVASMTEHYSRLADAKLASEVAAAAG
ncbi:site-specific integrase [soil metagenome]